MKRTLKCVILITGLFVFSNQTVSSQGNLRLNAGMGFAELMNLGIRYQPGKTGLGFNMGTWPYPHSTLFSVGGDVYYHFGGQSVHTALPLWYARGGVIYTRDENSERLFENTFLDLRAGRVINLSERFGLEVDAGIGFNLNYHFQNKQPGSWMLDLRLPIIPTLGARGFMRL
jgi:hypothetical protein